MWGMGKLSVRKIREATEPGRYGDGDGLYLHVRPGGSRQWLLRVTVRGSRRDIGLGSAELVTLAQAREKALQMRRDAKQGIDPVAARRKEVGIPTYEEAARKVWEERRGTWKNPKHAAQWMSTQQTYVFPFIGGLSVNTVTSADVLKLLQPIWNAKEETARRVRQRMNMVFEWAKVAGYNDGDNPLQGIERALPKQKHAVRHQAAMQWKDVPSFYRELAERHEDTISAKALRLLILTALRSSEVRLAKWAEFDLQEALWTVPADRMKMVREHRVPLTDEAIRLLLTCQDNGSAFVFPGPKPERPLSENAFAQLTRRMGKIGFTTHGFRSSFRDWSSETTAEAREVAEAALAHAVGDRTEQAYARSDLFKRRQKLMKKWTDFVAGSDAADDLTQGLKEEASD